MFIKLCVASLAVSVGRSVDAKSVVRSVVIDAKGHQKMRSKGGSVVRKVYDLVVGADSTIQAMRPPAQFQLDQSANLDEEMPFVTASQRHVVAPQIAFSSTVHGALGNGRSIGGPGKGLGTDACEDMYHATWVKNNNTDRWFVESKYGDRDIQYQCGHCSVKCGVRSPGYEPSYHLDNIKECPTRQLTAPSLLNCDAVQGKQKTIKLVFFGSSHTRVLYYHIWRLLAGLPWPADLPAGPGEVGSIGTLQKHQKFPRHNAQFNLCGGKVSVETYFQFKKFYKVGIAEKYLLGSLEEKNFTNPDLFVTEASIWSVYEQEMLVGKTRLDHYLKGDEAIDEWTPSITLEGEQDEYLSWLAHHFSSGKTHTIVQLGTGEGPGEKPFDGFMASMRRIGAQKPAWRACALDKEVIARPPDGMVCVHGCDGPVPMIQAQAILRSALKAKL